MTRSIFRIFVAIIVTLLPAALCAGEREAASPEALIRQAEKDYKAGKYPESVENFQKVAMQSGDNAALLCNLGNAYVKSGDYGHAMVSYMRALRIDPSNAEARQNRDFVAWRVSENNKAEIKGKKVSTDAESPSFFQSVRNFICVRHSSDVWAVWGAVCFILFIACVAVYVFVRRVMWRKIGFFGGGSLLFLTAIFLLFSFYAARAASSRDEAVITEYKVNLLGDPSASAKKNPIALTRGTVVSVLDTKSDGNGNPQWYKVRLNSDFIGWVEAAQCEVI